MKSILFFLLLSFSINVNSQPWLALGGASSFISYCANSICSDGAGNIYASYQNSSNGSFTVSKWNGSFWNNIGNSTPIITGIIIATHCDLNNNLYVGGQFATLAKFNGSTWSQIFPTIAIGNVTCICSDPSGNIYCGGTMGKVVKWNGSTWTELSGLNANGAIKAICRDAFGNIFVGGDFSTASVSSSGFKYVAKWNGSSWVNTGFQGNAIITCLTSDHLGNVYVGGNFTNGSTSSSVLRHVSKYNGSNWSILGTSFANQQINTIYCDGAGGIYAGGRFTNGSNKNYVAKWNGSSWFELGGANNLNANNEINTVHIDHTGNVYAGGRFNNLGSNSIAKFSQFVAIDNCIADNKPSVYPSPNNGNMKILLEKSQIGENLIILNSLGQIILQTIIESNELNVNITVPSGEYFLKVGNKFSQPIIVIN